MPLKHPKEVAMTETNELGGVFRDVPIPLYRSNPDGDILAANPAMVRLFGYESLSAMTRDLAIMDTVYLDPSQRTKWMEELDRAGVVTDFDVELRRPDGSTVWARDSARAVKNSHGEVLFYEGSLVDVTDKINAERAKDEFIATVSHELRNPIAVMVGLGAELANSYESFSDTERREMAQLIARQADEAGWLIEDLLVANRDDLNQVMIAPTTFDVTKEIERVLEVVDEPIETQACHESTAVYADPGRTRQILRNLVTNAFRYGGDKVMVRLARLGDRMEICVSDSGDPIADSDVERIFRPFERGSGPHHPKSIGLGLSVARRLARLMEGDLIYRYQEGRSCFVLSLPSA